MKNHSYEINIKLKFGSDFQRSTWSKMARSVVNTFGEMFKNAHRNNDIELRFGPPEKPSAAIDKKGAVHIKLPPVSPQTAKRSKEVVVHHSKTQS